MAPPPLKPKKVAHKDTTTPSGGQRSDGTTYGVPPSDEELAAAEVRVAKLQEDFQAEVADRLKNTVNLKDLTDQASEIAAASKIFLKPVQRTFQDRDAFRNEVDNKELSESDLTSFALYKVIIKAATSIKKDSTSKATDLIDNISEALETGGYAKVFPKNFKAEFDKTFKSDDQLKNVANINKLIEVLAYGDKAMSRWEGFKMNFATYFPDLARVVGMDVGKHQTLLAASVIGNLSKDDHAKVLEIGHAKKGAGIVHHEHDDRGRADHSNLTLPTRTADQEKEL